MEDIPIPNEQKKYISTLKDYYERKKQYDLDYKKKKKAILKKKELSTTEKLFKIQQIKMPCIQCGMEGGTLFNQENKVLTATCLASEPCDLNINIKLSNTINLRENIEKYNKIVEKLKNDIIITKLSLIFDLEREDIVSQKFNAIKDNYKENDKILEVFKNIFDDNINFVRIEDEETGEINRIKRENFIKDMQEILNKHINDFNKSVKLYEKDSTKHSLTESIEIYLDKILPILYQIRQKKYNITYIDVVNNVGFNGESLGEKIYINQHKNYINDYFHTHEEGEILKHDVKVVNKRQVKRRRRKKKKEPEKEPVDESKERKHDGPRPPEEKGETPDGTPEKEELSVKDEASSKSGEKPILKKKSDEVKKLSDLDELEEFDPEIDS